MRQKEGTGVWSIVTILAFGALFMYTDRTTLYPMLKIILEDLDISATATGAITSAYFFFYVVMQVPAGLLGDRFGSSLVLSFFYLFGGICLLFLGIWGNSYAQVLVLVALHGLGMGAFYPNCYGINIASVPQKNRGLASGIINSGLSLGTVFGLCISGVLYSVVNNWRVPFIILAIPTLLLPFVFLRTLPQLKKKPEAESMGEKKEIYLILKDKNIWFLNLAVFCSGYGFWVALIWGPSYFATERCLNLIAAGIITAMAAISAIPSSLFMGRLSDRIGRKRLTLILYPLAALTVLTLTFVHSVPVLVILLLFYGIVGRTTSDTIIVSWFGDYISGKAPKVLSTAVGLFNFVGMTSAVIAPLISGRIKDLTGSFNGAFYLGAFVIFVGMLFCFLAKED
jgi:MFS family permease